MNGEIDQYDVIILGAGVAGLSAAMWCSELGLRSMVLEEKPEIGGQLHWIHTPILNYPGIETENGAAFLGRLQMQLRNREFETRTNAKAARIDFRDMVVFLGDGYRLRGKALILATGIRRRTLGIDGENDFAGKGMLETGQTDRQFLAGKRLMIVGGGDAAFENAAVLSQYAEHVYLLHRKSVFAARTAFVDKVISNSKVELITDAAVKKLTGRNRLESVEYVDGKTGAGREVSVDALLIRIGVAPNSGLFRGDVDLDDRGYVRVSSLSETSAIGVFAIGDVANPISPTIATAAGTAAIAAKSIRSLLSRDESSLLIKH